MKSIQHLVSIAQQGLFEANGLVLLPSVFKDLKKEGLKVTKTGTKNGARNKVFISSINWENAYEDGVPVIVTEYISGKSKIYPKEEIKNLAQKLFVLSSMTSK